jgi:hypothetical protein
MHHEDKGLPKGGVSLEVGLGIVLKMLQVAKCAIVRVNALK